MEDIETILDTLVYDGKVEKTIAASANTSSERGADQVWLYRTLTPLIPPTGLMRMPCGVCPVSTSNYNQLPGYCVQCVQFLFSKVR